MKRPVKSRSPIILWSSPVFRQTLQRRPPGSLTSILTSGPRCGVHAIITWSPDQPLPRSFDVEVLRNTAQFHISGDHVFPRPSPVSSTPAEKPRQVRSDLFDQPTEAGETPGITADVRFLPVRPPESAEYVQIVRSVGEQSRNAKSGSGVYPNCSLRRSCLVVVLSGRNRAPIGRAGAARLQYLRLDAVRVNTC